MSVSPEWLEFLREQFPKGSRIELKEQDSNTLYRLPVGAKGTLDCIDDASVFDVQWDSGEYLGISIGQDRFSVTQPEAHTMRLYMPLTADLYERNDWGDMEDTPTELDGCSLTDYEDKITAALLRNRLDEEAERGIMHWYGEDDGVNRKVRSVVFGVEERNGELWGVAECRVIGELEPQELETLKEYISGQASDGWGEGFEQREIELDRDRELYVHLWDSEGEWSIQTEQERFGPRIAQGLPDLCFSVIKSTGELICIKRGVEGYFPSDWSTPDRERNEEIAADQNQRLGVTEAQRQAMECGSMCGWGVPGADPKFYEQHAPQMGGMTLGYLLSPEMRTFEETAEYDLRFCLGDEAAEVLLPHVNLYQYGRALQEREQFALTDYGRVQRVDCQPLMAENQKEQPTMGGMEMTQG